MAEWRSMIPVLGSGALSVASPGIRMMPRWSDGSLAWRPEVIFYCIFNPWRSCPVRVTVLVIFALQATRRHTCDTNSFRGDFPETNV